MKKYFTLVEVLGVVALIAILGAIGFAGYSYSVSSARESSTKSLIERFSNSLENCRTQNGFIPAARGEFSPINITLTDGDEKITIKDSGSNREYKKGDSNKNNKKFYAVFTRAMDMDSIANSLGDDGVLLDAWGNPVYYRYPGIINKGNFDIISAGPDGVFGTDGDSTPPNSIAKYRENGEMVCDDIGNF